MKSVYVMKSNNTYKIGVSKNPRKRLHELKIGNCDIELIFESKKLSNAYAVESALHKQFYDCAVGREWFAVCDESKLIDAVHTAVDEIGVCAVNAERKMSEDEQVDNLISWIFSPQKRRLEELSKEVNRIAEENRTLSERLAQLGWTCEEIECLVDTTLKNAAL